MKQTIIGELLLVLPDYFEPFEVHTNAYDSSINGVLMQGKYPKAF